MPKRGRRRSVKSKSESESGNKEKSEENPESPEASDYVSDDDPLAQPSTSQQEPTRTPSKEQQGDPLEGQMITRSRRKQLEAEKESQESSNRPPSLNVPGIQDFGDQGFRESNAPTESSPPSERGSDEDVARFVERAYQQMVNHRPGPSTYAVPWYQTNAGLWTTITSIMLAGMGFFISAATNQLLLYAQSMLCIGIFVVFMRFLFQFCMGRWYR